MTSSPSSPVQLSHFHSAGDVVSSSITTSQIHLIRRPEGLPRPGDFTLVRADLPALGPGQVLVENLYMSVDPYMRRSMDAEAKDLEPWPLNAPLNGPSVGRVLASRHPGYRSGDIVESMSGWQAHFISDGEPFIPYLSADSALAVRNHGDGVLPKDYLGLLGIAAMTGYSGIACAAAVQEGQTLVVSSGAGTVGSVACQVGKNLGMRVISSAGSDAKVSWLLEVAGIDHAFNYQATPLSDALAAACPDGIDVVLENASPEHLSACLPLMKERGLLLIAGFISMYATGGRANPVANFEYVLDRYLTIRAFPFMDFLSAYDAFVEDMIRWRTEGRLVFREQIHDGLESAPSAFCSLFTGESFGKNLVRIGT